MAYLCPRNWASSWTASTSCSIIGFWNPQSFNWLIDYSTAMLWAQICQWLCYAEVQNTHSKMVPAFLEFENISMLSGRHSTARTSYGNIKVHSFQPRNCVSKHRSHANIKDKSTVCQDGDCRNFNTNSKKLETTSLSFTSKKPNPKRQSPANRGTRMTYLSMKEVWFSQNYLWFLFLQVAERQDLVGA